MPGGGVIYCAHSNTGRNMNTYFILSHATERYLRDGKGNMIAIQARTEREAKAAYERTAQRRVDWSRHSPVRCAVV